MYDVIRVVDDDKLLSYFPTLAKILLQRVIIFAT